MDDFEWTSTSIQKLFKLNLKNKQTLFNAEKRKEIPLSIRKERGKTKVRLWKTEDLPQIGEKFGFIKKISNQKIICLYTAKGGVLKTTLAYNIARILALNGLNTLIIGLDIQCSITDICIPPIETENLEDHIEQNLGIYHILYEKAPFEKVIKNTNLPTLKVIPETPDLNVLEKKIRDETRREYILKDKIISNLSQYDVIVIDNSPSWNMLIENALLAANIVISPIGCEIGTYHSLQTNLTTLYEFRETMKINWDHFFLVPTLLEKTKLSQQIYGTYLNEYKDNIIPHPIRRAVKGQEALLLRKSIIEHDINSPLSQDYFELINALWEKISYEKNQ